MLLILELEVEMRQCMADRECVLETFTCRDADIIEGLSRKTSPPQFTSHLAVLSLDSGPEFVAVASSALSAKLMAVRTISTASFRPSES